MLTLTDFSGGLWLSDQTDFAIPPNALLQAQNIDYLPSGALRGRRGYTKYNASLLPGSVLSLWRHYPRSGTPATLAAFVNAATVEIRHDTVGAGTFAAVTGGTGFAAATRWHFTNWPSKNKTFLANGSDNLRAYNGVLADMGAIPKKGPYLTVWQSHLWATDPTELNYSVYASEVDDETVWPADNHLNVSDAQGGRIVGLVGWQDRLIILKSTGLWSFFGDIDLPVSSNLQQYSDKGCVSDLSIDVTPEGIIYQARDGVRITDGLHSEPIEISRPIRSSFLSASTQIIWSTALGIWYPRRQQYWLSLAAGSWPTTIATRLLKTDGHKNFSWSTVLGHPTINAACTWDSEAEDGRLLVGDTTGQVWTMDTGITDNGAAIASTIKLPALLLDPQQQRFGRVVKVKTLHRSSVALAGAIEYDFSGVSDVSFGLGGTGIAVRDSRATLWDTTKLGRFAALGLSNPSDSSAFELHRVDMDLRLKNARRWP